MRIPDLKPKSADFNDHEQKDVSTPDCDIPGCPFGGLHRAPKSRDLDEYYNFCTDHVTEYNKNWNYFEGMSQRDIEEHMYRAMTWDRPTWVSNLTNGMGADYLKQRVYEGIRMDGFDMGGSFNKEDTEKQRARINMPAPEVDALDTLGLEPPVEWSEIRKQYKKLVKKHHPDVSEQKDEDVEKIKQINLAYSILRVAYQKFEKLEKKKK
jgi:hypothetical protein